VPPGYLYVDGIVGDVGQGVLRDRKVLAEEGVVVVVVTVDVQTGKVLTGPEIITRGWVYAPEAEDLLDEASAIRDVEALERDVGDAAGKVSERTKRRPMIVPVVDVEALSSATCAGPPAKFVTTSSRPAVAGPMIVTARRHGVRPVCSRSSPTSCPTRRSRRSASRAATAESSATSRSCVPTSAAPSR
jgi:hypothetical protein